jgi:peptide deformylase
MLRPPLVGVDGLDHPWPEFPGGEVARDRVPPDLPRHWPPGSFAHLRSPATSIPVIDQAGSVPYLRRVSKLDIITLPDRKLRMKSVPVERVDDELRAFMDSMVETMYAAPGIGLAAIQVNVPRRIVTIDVAQREDETASPDPLFLINPEILWSSDERAVAEEGCLSIPEYFAEVERPASVRVAYLDRNGKPREMDAEGVLAVCLQHEIDHLDGKLFIDHLSKLKRDMVIKKFAKQARVGPKSPVL